MAAAGAGAAVGAKRKAGGLVWITEWNGNLGNNLCQLAHAFLFAKLHGSKVVRLPSAINVEEEQVHAASRSQPLLSIPRTVSVRERDGGQQVLDGTGSCEAAERDYLRRDGSYKGTWWTSRCRSRAPREYHAVMQKYVRPLLSADLMACLDATAPAEDLLTIHLRGGDIFSRGQEARAAKAHTMLWNSPPCGMYEKVIVEEGFRRVLVVTSPDRRHPCLAWLKKFAESRGKDGGGAGLEVIVQSASLLEDVCSMLSARHLVLAYSTLSESLALLSDRLRVVYCRSPHIWLEATLAAASGAVGELSAGTLVGPHRRQLGKGKRKGEEGPRCLSWPGVAVKEYEVPVSAERHEGYGGTANEAEDWLLTFPASEIRGPRAPC